MIAPKVINRDWTVLPGPQVRWRIFLDDRRGLRLKWGLLVLILLAAALLEVPL